jgi:hypothetical protein
MKLTEQETENFKDGILMHCGEAVSWVKCDLHTYEDTDCMEAVCMECLNSWCDYDNFGGAQ